MLKHVTLVEAPQDPKSWERHEVEDVRAFLASRYSSFPPTARIYHESVSFETDVTPQDEADIERLGELTGPFYVVVYPEGGFEFLVIGLILAAGAYMLMPSFSAPVAQPPPVLARSNQQAASPNNELSDRANRARINGRIPDIYGTVRSTPDLIAAPYKIFENGREVEYAYMCVGRGQYDISEVRDGETLVENIPGSSVMIYGPYTSPNSYDPADPDNTGPELTIGEQRIVPVLNAKRSNSVNGQVLRPPNSVSYTNSQSQIRFVWPNRIEIPEDSDQDLTKYFVDGDIIEITDAVLTTDPITVNVNFFASRFPRVFEWPGGTKYYPENTDNARIFFPASFADLLQAYFAVNDDLTLNTESVTSVGDLDGTYNVGPDRVVGPDTPEEQAAGLPSYYIIDLSNASSINATWDTMGGYVYFSSPLTFASAPFEIDLNGTYTVTSVSKNVIVLDNPNAVNTDWDSVLQTHGQTPFMNASISGTGDRWVGPFILEDTQLVEVFTNFIASNGLYKDDGTLQEAAEVTVEIELTPVGIDDEPLGAAETFQTTLVGSTFLKETVGKTLKCHPGFFGRTAIRARRITEADTAFEGLVVDEVRWRDAYSVSYVEQSDFGNVTTAFSITFATASALAVKERKLNMIAQRKLPAWDGEEFSAEFTATNDAATILAAVCRDRYIGNRSLSELDLGNFFDTADAVQTYFGTARAREFCYTFDKDQLSFEEIVNTIAQAMFCVAYRRGNVIRLSFEQATEDSTLLFNHRNKLPGTEKRTVNFGVSQDNDGVQYTYVDPRDDSVATIFLPPEYAAINPKRIESIGVRNYLQAYFQAWRAWNKVQYQNMLVEFEATQEADLLVINDRILVSDGTRPHSQEGEVMAVDGLELTLSQNVDLTIDASYVIFLQHYDGTVESISITAGTDANQVVLGEAPALSLVTSKESTVRTGYIIVGSSDSTQKAFLTSEKTPAGRMTSTVKAGNYDARFYDKDKDYILGLIDEEAYGPNGNYTPDTGTEFPEEDAGGGELPLLLRRANPESTGGVVYWDQFQEHFIAACPGGVYTSPDGETWTLHSNPATTSAGLAELTDVLVTNVEDNHVILMTGNNSGGDIRILRNQNSLGWAAATPANSTASRGRSLAYDGAGTWLATGSIQSFSSTNQMVWTAPLASSTTWTGRMNYGEASARTSWPRSFNKTVFGHGRFVSLTWSANSGEAWLLSSADGVTWVDELDTEGFVNSLSGGVLGVGSVGFLAIHNDFSRVAHSADGETWQMETTALIGDLPYVGAGRAVGSVIYSETRGLWIAITSEDDGEDTLNHTRLWTSPDGLTWTQDERVDYRSSGSTLAFNADESVLLTYMSTL